MAHSADRIAFERLANVSPAWAGVRPAADAIGLGRHELLHCGPPAAKPGELVIPTLNSAAVACVFEGWASQLDEAFELVRSGEVTFAPAQDRGVATPMAAVVSPSMPLLELRDTAGSGAVGWSPINGGGTGGDPAPRYGRRSEAALDFLRFLSHEVGDALSELAVEPLTPLPWLALMDAALTEGDDGHLRHGAAHARLIGQFERHARPGLMSSPAGEFMRKWPFFHLNFFMAAVRCAMSAAEGVEGSSLVTAFGGNGAEFGLQMSAFPRRWFTVEATPPRGKVREPFGPDSGVGAYGDSAVVEAFGLGAMAHRFAPDMQALHAGFAPQEIFELPAQLLTGAHPAFTQSGALAGLSVRRVVAARRTPVVELGIVEATGEGGGLGAGIYRPPLELFEQALAALPTG